AFRAPAPSPSEAPAPSEESDRSPPGFRLPPDARFMLEEPAVPEEAATAEGPTGSRGPGASGAPDPAPDPLTGLSEAERRVARLAAGGFTNRQIARRLHVTASTVEQHLTRIYRKLRIRRRTDLPRVSPDLPATPAEA
ncbi:LuxR C-terminal-related transcriptional regulator, partial [Actinomadura harenae]